MKMFGPSASANTSITGRWSSSCTNRDSSRRNASRWSAADAESARWRRQTVSTASRSSSTRAGSSAPGRRTYPSWSRRAPIRADHRSGAIVCIVEPLSAGSGAVAARRHRNRRASGPVGSVSPWGRPDRARGPPRLARRQHLRGACAPRRSTRARTEALRSRASRGTR